MQPMYVAREIGRNILSYVNFSRLYDAIKSFPSMKQIVGIEVQERLNGKMILLEHYNHMLTNFIQACTLNS